MRLFVNTSSGSFGGCFVAAILEICTCTSRNTIQEYLIFLLLFTNPGPSIGHLQKGIFGATPDAHFVYVRWNSIRLFVCVTKHYFDFKKIFLFQSKK